VKTYLLINSAVFMNMMGGTRVLGTVLGTAAFISLLGFCAGMGFRGDGRVFLWARSRACAGLVNLVGRIGPGFFLGSAFFGAVRLFRPIGFWISRVLLDYYQCY
jgi:hypothetical protein